MSRPLAKPIALVPGDSRPATASGPMAFDLRFVIINKIGLIDSLSAGVATRLLETLSLPAPLFGLLHLFAERPDLPRTVTQLAKATNAPQPGVSKRVQKLVQRGLLREQPSDFDARQKLLFLTPEGRAQHAQAINLLVPAAGEVFADWNEADIQRLGAALDRIQATLTEKF